MAPPTTPRARPDPDQRQRPPRPSLRNPFQPAERVLDQAHMMEHRGVRRRRIAGEDRLDHGGVFGVRARQAPFGAKLRAAEGRDAPTQAGGEVASISLCAPDRSGRGSRRWPRRKRRGRRAARSPPSPRAGSADGGARSASCSSPRAARRSPPSPPSRRTGSRVARKSRSRRVAPRRGLTSIRPVEASCRSASRTGVRDTPKRSREHALVETQARRELARQHGICDGVGEPIRLRHALRISTLLQTPSLHRSKPGSCAA